MNEPRIFYISPEVVVMTNPFNGNTPTIVLRNHRGEPTVDDFEIIEGVLRILGMELDGDGDFRDDGLWYCKLKEV